MNALERALFERPPLDEAAAFFLKLKTAAPEDGMAPPAQEPMGQGAPTLGAPAPDVTGQLEGEFAVPVEQVLPVLAMLAENEFKTMLAYHVYAESLRGLEREGIAEEFEEHAEDEISHAEFLLRRMSVLGGPIQLADIPAPPAMSDAHEIIQTMITMEQEGIAKWKELLAMLGDNPTKYEVEAFLTREQHHLDELWQLLPWDGQAAQPAPGVGAGAGAPPPATEQTTNSAVQSSDKEPPKAQSVPGPVSVKIGGASVGFAKTVAQPAAAAAQKAHQAAAAAINTDKAKGVKRVGELLSGSRVDRFRNALNKNRGAGWPYKHLYHHEVGEEALHEAGRVSKARAGAAAAGGAAVGGAAAHHKHDEKEKKAAMKQAFERIAPGTAHCHSPRMLAVLEALPGRVYYAEEEKTASVRFRAGISKLSDIGGSFGGPAVQSLQRPAAGGGFEGMPDIEGFLANEQAAAGAEEQASAGYYQQRFQQAAEQLKQLQETQAALEQQIAQSDQQIQAAMQSTQSAQSTATQALSQALTSSDEALKNKTLAASMRQAYQTLRGQMMDIASQDPAAQIGTELAGSAAAAAQVPGQTPGQVPGQAGGQAGGQPGGATGESAPTSGAPTGDTGPAGQAPGAQSAPGAAPPEGETGAQNPANSSGPQGADRSGAQPSTHVSVKTSGVMDSAPVREGMKRLPYAIAGGALGAGAGALEARPGGAEKLRGKVQELEGRPGSFGNAMQQAAAKFRLALAEAGEEHPGAATLAGGLAGAALGAGAGPALHDKVRNIGQSAKDIREAV